MLLCFKRKKPIILIPKNTKLFKFEFVYFDMIEMLLSDKESDLEEKSDGLFLFGGFVTGFFSEPILMSLCPQYTETLQNYFLQAGLSSIPAGMYGKNSRQRTLNVVASATGLFTGQVCSFLLRKFAVDYQ